MVKFNDLDDIRSSAWRPGNPGTRPPQHWADKNVILDLCEEIEAYRYYISMPWYKKILPSRKR